MKAITLWQPWASLVAVGAKTIETRSWRTHYRGPIAIHAAKRPVARNLDRGFVGVAANWLRKNEAGQFFDWDVMDELPYGCVIATAFLVDILPTDRVNRHVINGREETFGDFSPGRFAWFLIDIKPVDPIPYRGKQGLWTLPDEAVRKAV